MAWVKIDDQFSDHPKVIEAGPLASWLYVCGLTYCGRYLTDGWIPKGQLRKLADVDNAQELADKLVAVGLWDVVDGGYNVHDFLIYNPSGKQVKAKRDANARRQADWREHHRGNNGTYSNAASNAVTNAVVTTAPSPSPSSTDDTERIYLEILEIWRELFPAKTQPKATTDSLRKKLRTRLKVSEFRDNWHAAMERASRSTFCNDGNWCKVGWFLANDDNWRKALDGDYDDKRGGTGHKPPIATATTDFQDPDEFFAGGN